MLHSIVSLRTHVCVCVCVQLDWIQAQIYTQTHAAVSAAPGGRLSHPMCPTVLRCPPCHHGPHCLMPENNDHLNITENTHTYMASVCGKHTSTHVRLTSLGFHYIHYNLHKTTFSTLCLIKQNSVCAMIHTDAAQLK